MTGTGGADIKSNQNSEFEEFDGFYFKDGELFFAIFALDTVHHHISGLLYGQ